ncbi:4Fe-4S dicluster domain-containing protein [Nocardia sp. NPDC055029]
MAFVITDICIGCKDSSCATECPVGCIHPQPGEQGYETAAQLYIDPVACIDCNVCSSVCPVDAIYPADLVPAEHAASVLANAVHYASSTSAEEPTPQSARPAVVRSGAVGRMLGLVSRARRGSRGKDEN